MSFAGLMTVEDISRRILFDRRVRQRRSAALEQSENMEFNAGYNGERRQESGRRRVERRQLPKVMNYFWYTLVFWIMMSVVVTILFIFVPDYIEDFFPRSSLVTLKFTYYIFSVAFFLTLSLLYNQFRNRRGSDKANFFTITATVVSILSLAVYLIFNYGSFADVLKM